MKKEALECDDLLSDCDGPQGGLGLWSLSVAEAGRRIAIGDLSPVDLVEAALARVAEVDGALNSFIYVMEEQARRDARVAAEEISERGPRGPLHGIPFAVKDNYDVAGVPTTAGSRARLASVPLRDATLVAALRNAGAVLIGKLSTWEFGTGNGGEYFDLPFPPARNPWDLSRFTGGSSTGAGAAVSAGLVGFALGSDTTGSVRLPAAACGATGMIATAGRLSLQGILPNCHSLDVPGPICRSAEDLMIVLDALIGDEALRPAAQLPLEGMRVAVVRDPGLGMPAPNSEMATAFDYGLSVLRGEGVHFIEAGLATSAAECLAITQMIGPAESAAIHEEELREGAGDLGYALRDKLLAGSVVRAVDYLQAQRRRTEVAAEIDALFADVDAVVTFGALAVAPRLGVEPEMTAYTRETMLTPFNLSGHPALVQRTGFTKAGLPTHWQIVSGRGQEGVALRLAIGFERAAEGLGRWPKVAGRTPALSQSTGPDTSKASEAFCHRAARMGLGGLGKNDLGRMETLEAVIVKAGASLRRPSGKAVPPAFGMQRPSDCLESDADPTIKKRN